MIGSDMIDTLYASDDLADTFSRITGTAIQVLDACDFASVTTVSGGELTTEAPTDQAALTADLLQYQEGEGPCLDAATRDRWVLTPDVLADRRWPKFSARLGQELKVHSMLSVRLAVQSSPQRNLGGLNLYSTRVNAFDTEQRDLALLLAAVASVAADATRTHAQLRAGLQSRQVIGEAIGILRAQSNLTSEEAFAALVQASQRMNLKLRDIAMQIVQREGGLTPTPTGRGHHTRA